MLTPRIDVALLSPIRRAPVVPGASVAHQYQGVASTGEMLARDGKIEQVPADAIDATVAALDRGIPIISPEDHQIWLKDPTYRPKTEGMTTRGWEEDGCACFSASVIDDLAKADIDSGATPCVSLGYVARDAAPTDSRADVMQIDRDIHHLARVPKGRDPGAYIRIDTGDDMDPTVRIDADPPAEGEGKGGADSARYVALIDALKALDPKDKMALALLKGHIEVMEGGAAKVEPPMTDAKEPPPALVAARADALKAQARADAAEKELAALKTAARAEQLAGIKARVDADPTLRDLKIAGLDNAAPTDADLAAVEIAIGRAALGSIRVDADPYAKPTAKPPPRREPEVTTTPTRTNRFGVPPVNS